MWIHDKSDRMILRDNHRPYGSLTGQHFLCRFPSFMKFRPLISTLLLLTLLLAFGACATKPAGFPHAKGGPTASSTKTPSECLSRGKAAEDRNEWAAAYRWYARGGG